MHKQKAFSLIELLVTISIVGILCAIAYPIYGNYISKTRRSQAQQNLLIISQNLEVYHAEHQSYLDANIAAVAPSDIANNEYYTYQIQELTDESYQLIAIPKQADTECGTLTIDQLGEKTSSGTAALNECWLG